MVNLDGATIILALQFGYFDPFMVDLAKVRKSRRFATQRRYGARPASKENLGSYFGHLGPTT
jgi:hypothetical protein